MRVVALLVVLACGSACLGSAPDVVLIRTEAGAGECNAVDDCRLDLGEIPSGTRRESVVDIVNLSAQRVQLSASLRTSDPSYILLQQPSSPLSADSETRLIFAVSPPTATRVFGELRIDVDGEERRVAIEAAGAEPPDGGFALGGCLFPEPLGVDDVARCGVIISNQGTRDLVVDDAIILGVDADVFQFMTFIRDDAAIPPSASVSLDVAASASAPGNYRAELRVLTSSGTQSVDLAVTAQ